MPETGYMKVPCLARKETLAKCLELTKKYELAFGGAPLCGGYFRNEFISILGEFAVSAFLTGSIQAAVQRREDGLAADRICSGSDLVGFDIDVKTVGSEKPDCIYVHPKHVHADRIYVLVHIPCSLDAGEDELMEIETVDLIGWCYGSQLTKNDMENFHHGWHYRHVQNLSPMRDLK